VVVKEISQQKILVAIFRHLVANGFPANNSFSCRCPKKKKGLLHKEMFKTIQFEKK